MQVPCSAHGELYKKTGIFGLISDDVLLGQAVVTREDAQTSLAKETLHRERGGTPGMPK